MDLQASSPSHPELPESGSQPPPCISPVHPHLPELWKGPVPGAGRGALEDLASWRGAHLPLSHPPLTPFLSETSIADGGFPGPASEPGGGETCLQAGVH